MTTIPIPRGITDEFSSRTAEISDSPMPVVSREAIDLWAQKKEYEGKWVLAMNNRMIMCADTSEAIYRFVSEQDIDPRETLLIKF